MSNNTYTPITWINGPGGGTPINATNLNRMEAGISKAYDAIFTTVPNDSAIKAEITAAKNAAIQQAHEKDNAVKTEIANTYALKTEIPNVNNFVTKTELTSNYYTVDETDTAINEAIDKITIPDLTGYAKKTDIPTVPTKIGAFENDKNYLTQQSLTDYATKQYVTDEIEEAKLSSSGVDLSNYITNDLISTDTTQQIPSDSKPKAEGITSIAIGYEAYAEFEDSVAIGYGAWSSSDAQIALGRYNTDESGGVLVVGIGQGDANRRDGHVLDWNGNAWYAGKVTVGTGVTPTGDMDLTTKKYVDAAIAEAELSGGGGSSTDTKNTTGATNTSSKIYLVGATEQSANPMTYTHDTAYVGNDGCLYSDNKKVLVQDENNFNLSFQGYPQIGYNASVEMDADDSIAIGCEARVGGGAMNAVAIGHGAYVSSHDGQVAIGNYNTDFSDGVLIVGNGKSDDDRSDALIVHRSGNLWVSGGVYVSTVNEDGVPEFTPTQENHLTTKFYVDNEIAGLQNDIKKQITDMLLNGTW